MMKLRRIDFRGLAAACRTLGAALGCAIAVAGITGCSADLWTYAAPTVTNPVNATVNAGDVAVFSATAKGAAPLTYQWLKNGVAIPGSATNAYTTPPATSADSGALFSLRVSNGYGEATSAPATLTVVTLASDYPVITSSPVAANVCSNSTVTLSVAATNATGFQWEFNGTPIVGATNSTYTIANAQPAQSGVYTCVVSNALASVTTSPVTVSIGSTITTQPANASVTAGQVGTFTVAATGQGPFTYQWYKIAPSGVTGAAIVGAVSGTYVTPVTGTNDSGSQFYAIVTDACGTVYTSSTATMTVLAGDVPPTIVQQPAGEIVAPGASATFSALASGTPTITYQWYRIPAGQAAGAAVGGATGASYTVPSGETAVANNGDQYYVIATNAYGQATSQDATLAVSNGILITKQPVSQYVQVGQTATFSVTATSTLPLTYQWFEAVPGSGNFTAIAGATSASYSVTNTMASEYGTVVYVVVSNSASSLTSASAGLFVGALNQIANLCSSTWLPHGSTVELGAGTGNCSFQLTDAGSQSGQLVWQQLIATANLQMSFTITMSNASNVPGDGFTVTLADPSQGATLTSTGASGMGLGAKGIPGFVLGFDTYENGPPDAPIVPYVGVTRGNTALWENPWFNYNDNIAPIVVAGQVIQTNFSITLVNGQIAVTQNGSLIFSGAVSAVPPVAYLFVTASTGSAYETVVISNFSGVVGNP